MTHRKFIASCPWSRYSKKLALRIEHPTSVGFFTPEEAAAKGMRLVIGEEGSCSDGNQVVLFWLVDESDGVIVDAKFQVFGPTALIGAADIACELAIHKNFDQVRRFTADLIDRHVRDIANSAAFPPETFSHLNQVLFAIENAVEKCLDISFEEAYVSPPLDSAFLQGEEGGVYPGWEQMGVDQKIAVIEQVIANEIRPYIELDAGGVQVINFLEDRELIIAYQGACTSCYSATGATLNAIQQILRTKVHPEIIVTPDLNFSKKF